MCFEQRLDLILVYIYFSSEKQRLISKTPRGGFGPPTLRLTVECSTIELPGNFGTTHFHFAQCWSKLPRPPHLLGVLRISFALIRANTQPLSYRGISNFALQNYRAGKT